MPNNEEVTYLERLTANNEVIEEIDNVTELLPNSTTSQEQKLAELETLIKKKAGNEAKPITVNSDFNYIKAGYNSTSNSYCKGYYSQGGGSSNATVKVYKINQDGTSTEIYIESGNIGSFCLVDVIDDYLYFYECSYDTTNVIKFYRINLDTYEKESYFNASEPSTYYGWTLYQIPFDNYHFLHHTYYYEIDLENKQIIKKYENDYLNSSRGNVHPRYLTFVNGRSNGYYIYDIETGRNSYTGNIGTGREIRFINQSATKVIMAKNLYALNPDLTVGNLIKENVAPDTRIYYCIGHDNLYITTDGWYTFDEETNTFTKTEGLNEVNVYGNTFSFKSANVLNLIIPENFDKIIGYTIENKKYFSVPDAVVSTNDILYGKEYRTVDGSIIQGTMPDNGTLNITPSTSSQSIPAGYTSGGTVSAVTSSIDSNIVAENIKKDVTILGVTGNFEGGINTDNTDLEVEDLAKKAEAYSAFTTLYPLTNITSMSNAFVNTPNIVTLTNIDTSNITDMSNMFNGCSNLANITAFSMNNVTNAEGMFNGCTSLTSESLKTIANMLPLASNLTNTTLENLGLASNMFEDRSLRILVNLGYTDAQPVFNPNPNYIITINT